MTHTIGRYQIVGVIGEGGFGTVHLATDPTTGTPVAIKVINSPELTEVREMFRAEVSALLAVDHPHVVRVREVIDQPGLLALVTDYVDGASLRTLLEQAGPLSDEQAVSVLRGALDGLAAVHAAGLVHADLKPDNIIVDTTGTARLIDFGLTGPPRTLAGPDTWVGTPSYLAPEVVLGSHIDARSDIYAVGAVLFELLTGRVPYRGPDAVTTAELHVTAPVPDPRLTTPTALPGLADLAMFDLAKDPARRHQSATAFANTLTHLSSQPKTSTGIGVAATAGTAAGSLAAAVTGIVASSTAGAGLLGAPPVTAGLLAGAAGTGAAGAAAAGLLGTSGTTTLGTGGAATGATSIGAGAGAGASAGAAASTGALATIGGTKGAVAIVAGLAAVAAIGTGTAFLLTDEDTGPAPAAVPAATNSQIVATFVTSPAPTSDGPRTYEVHTLASDGSVSAIDESTTTDWYPPTTAASADGRHVATQTADGRLAVRGTTAPFETVFLDCDCRSPRFSDRGTLVALSDDAGIKEFTLTDDTWAVRSVPGLADDGPRDDADNLVLRDENWAGLAAVRDGKAFVLANEAYAEEGTEMYVVDLFDGSTVGTEIAYYLASTATSADGRYLAIGQYDMEGDTGTDSGLTGFSLLDLDSYQPDGAVNGYWLPLEGGGAATLPAFDDDSVIVVPKPSDGAPQPTQRYRQEIASLAPERRGDPLDWEPASEAGIAWSGRTPDGLSLELRDSNPLGSYDLWWGDTRVATNIEHVELVPPAQDQPSTAPADSASVDAEAEAAPTFFEPAAEIDGTGDTSAIAALPQDLRDHLAATARTTYQSEREFCDLDASYPSVAVEVYDPRGYARGGVRGCSGYVAFWRLDPDGWTEAWGGHDVPTCAEFDTSQLPASVLSDGVWSCYDGDVLTTVPGQP